MTYVVQLARTRYAGTNHTHLTELLMEREGIDLSRSTVRRILVGAGMDSPRRRRPPRHRVRRKRMAQEGMLLQIDGSHHRWLGEQGPRFVLLLAVDDATGTVPDALFSQEEDTRGYFLLMEGLIRQCGIPLAVYSDRHAVFKHTGEVGQKPARANPVRPRHGGAGDTPDIRQVTAGEGPGRADGGDIPGPAGDRAAPGGRHHHRRGQ